MKPEDMKNEINELFESVNRIDSFLKDFDKEIGLEFCMYDYVDAIWELRNTLVYIEELTSRMNFDLEEEKDGNRTRTNGGNCIPF